MTRPIAALLLSLPVLGSFMTAQTGPFVDGELLVKISDLGPETLYRIDPVTGNAAPLVTDLYGGYANAGWLAFDSWRGGVLAFSGYHPYSPFSPRLFLIREDGGMTDLLGPVTTDLRSLAPVGDGRVYLRKDGVLNLLDATNTLTPVLDHVGQPITLDLRHLVYEPGTDSLVGVLETRSTTAPCDGPQVISIHRLPLAPGGAQLSGPIVCGNATTYSNSPIGLDALPGGTLLLTFADKAQFQANSLLQVDPVTLTGSNWAATTLPDLNGGVWSQPLGKAVVWDDWNNELRTFSAGSTGTGTLLPTSIQVGGGTTGTSSRDQMSDVNLGGPLCGGLVRSFGTGLAGKQGRVPNLGVASCPTIGTTLSFTVTNAIGGGLAVVVLGTASTAFPFKGGTLYVLPPFNALLVSALSGIPGSTGAGFTQLDLGIPNNPALIGLPVFAQAGISDVNALQGWALTQALEIQAQ